jgi:hypothetical protein
MLENCLSIVNQYHAHAAVLLHRTTKISMTSPEEEASLIPSLATRRMNSANTGRVAS